MNAQALLSQITYTSDIEVFSSALSRYREKFNVCDQGLIEALICASIPMNDSNQRSPILKKALEELPNKISEDSLASIPSFLGSCNDDFIDACFKKVPDLRNSQKTLDMMMELVDSRNKKISEFCTSSILNHLEDSSVMNALRKNVYAYPYSIYRTSGSNKCVEPLLKKASISQEKAIFVPILKSNDYKVRLKALVCIRSVGHPERLKNEIIEIAKNERQSTSVLVETIHILKRWNNEKRVQKLLLEFLHFESEEVQVAAIASCQGVEYKIIIARLVSLAKLASPAGDAALSLLGNRRVLQEWAFKAVEEDGGLYYFFYFKNRKLCRLLPMLPNCGRSKRSLDIHLSCLDYFQKNFEKIITEESAREFNVSVLDIILRNLSPHTNQPRIKFRLIFLAKFLIERKNRENELESKFCLKLLHSIFNILPSPFKDPYVRKLILDHVWTMENRDMPSPEENSAFKKQLIQIIRTDQNEVALLGTLVELMSLESWNWLEDEETALAVLTLLSHSNANIRYNAMKCLDRYFTEERLQPKSILSKVQELSQSPHEDARAFIAKKVSNVLKPEKILV